jgi:hypothetical protein
VGVLAELMKAELFIIKLPIAMEMQSPLAVLAVVQVNNLLPPIHQPVFSLHLA